MAKRLMEARKAEGMSTTAKVWHLWEHCYFR